MPDFLNFFAIMKMDVGVACEQQILLKWDVLEVTSLQQVVKTH